MKTKEQLEHEIEVLAVNVYMYAGIRARRNLSKMEEYNLGVTKLMIIENKKELKLI